AQPARSLHRGLPALRRLGPGDEARSFAGVMANEEAQMSEPTDEGATEPGATPGRRCPICRKPTVQRYRPFCSARGADSDLGRWFTEAYRIPGDAVDETAEEPPGQTGGRRDEGG